MIPIRSVLLLLTLVCTCAGSVATSATLKIDRTRSFVDVDVKATVDSFTGRLDRYQAVLELDGAGKIKSSHLDFRFADLKTGKTDRDAKMMEWLGGGDPKGRFELGVLALAPDGQGQANGKLTFNGVSKRIEFPVNVTRTDSTLTVTGSVALDHRQWKLKVIRLFGLLKVDPNVVVRFQLVVELPQPTED